MSVTLIRDDLSRPELEREWRARLAVMTELALRYHALEDQMPDDVGSWERARMLDRLLAARHAWAEVDARLAQLRRGCPTCATLGPSGAS